MLVVIPRLYNSFFLTIQKRSLEKIALERHLVQVFFLVLRENCCARTVEFKIWECADSTFFADADADSCLIFLADADAELMPILKNWPVSINRHL